MFEFHVTIDISLIIKYFQFPYVYIEIFNDI